jgi:predicted  nucleic acid-binding Zn-ribbon protein
MGFFGKLLISIVLFMSILLMTLGLVVNRTHHNLKNERDELKTQVDAAQQTYKELVAKHKQLDVQLQREEVAVVNQLRKLEHERVTLIQRNKKLEQNLQALTDVRRERTGDVLGVQERNNRLADQVDDLRSEIKSNQQARDQAFVAVVQTTEELHQLQGQLEHTLERNSDLTKD